MPERHRRSASALLSALVVALVTLGGVFVSASPAAADVDDFTFDSFHADLQLSRAADGHAELAVVETIVARFPDFDQNRGIVRAIPDDYDDVPLHTEVTSVTNGDGDEIPYEIDRDGGFIEVATGDDSYVRGVQTYVIAYTQRDSIRSFADTDRDEFYRDINGTGWDQPFDEVSAAITVDADLTTALTGDDACYLGDYGSSQQCAIEGSGGTFEASADSLDAGENITVAVGFERGTFVAGEPQRGPVKQFAIDAAPGLQAATVGTAVLGVIAAAGAFVARRRGRDAAGRGVIVAQYAPPEGLSVMQAAHLVGKGAVATSAAIVDLAVAGNLRIIEHDEGYSLELVSPSRDAARQRVIDAIFATDAEPGAMVWLKGDTKAMASRLDELGKAEAARLRDEGLTEKRRQRGPATAFVVSLVAFFATFALLIFTAVNDVASPALVVAAIVAFLAVVVTAFAWRSRDRVTDAGAGARDHLIGLRDYLALAETDRIRMLQSPEGAERSASDVVHLYERLLPYAIIWGVEKDWAKVLETRAQESGETIGWYYGPNGFSSVYFLSALGQTHTSTTTAQTWSTSGSGSFSGGSMGGGFSGGGAGGGGGGGR